MARILIVEDKKAHRELLQANLLEDGYSVDSVASLSEASAMIHRKTYHVALIDLGLKGDTDPDDLSGQEIIELINNLNEGTKIIVVTKHVDVKIMRAMTIDLGADDFIAKRDISIEGTEYVLKAIRNQIAECSVDDSIGSVFDIDKKLFWPEGETVFMNKVQTKIGADVKSVHKLLLMCFNKFKPLCKSKSEKFGQQFDFDDLSTFTLNVWSKSVGDGISIDISNGKLDDRNYIWKRDSGELYAGVRLIDSCERDDFV